MIHPGVTLAYSRGRSSVGRASASQSYTIFFIKQEISSLILFYKRFMDSKCAGMHSNAGFSAAIAHSTAHEINRHFTHRKFILPRSFDLLKQTQKQKNLN